MRLLMQIGYAGSPRESAALVAELEQGGLDVAWIAEAYSFDAPSYMGYLAAKTNRVEIAAGILPIYTRTPTLLAMTAAGIDALSDGRCILGLGASGPQVVEGFHGVAPDPPPSHLPFPPAGVTRLGKPLKLINRPVRAGIPTYVAALGPKNVQMT